jgi:transposase
MALTILGIDIAKASYQATLLQDGKRYHRTFRNHPSDFAALAVWLGKHRVEQLHACMEATGTFWEELALHLHTAGHAVSVVNPAQIRHYARSQLRRNKTDQLDADLIALYCQRESPRGWSPPAPQIKELRALTRYLDDLQAIRTQEVNRLSSGICSARVRQGLEEHLAFLAEQIERLKQEIQDLIDAHEELCQQRALLVSIPGIGALTAAKLLGENIQSFPTARTLVAYAGLNPMIRQSGSSLHAKPQLSKLGSRHVRMTMYMPALSARRTNPLVKDFCDRLQARGKAKKAVLGAAMRKLLCLAFGVLKSGVPFDPHFVEKIRMIT